MGAKKQVEKASAQDAAKSGSRLYVKGVVAGYRRALTNQKSHTSLIKIQGVKDDTRFRVVWGRVCCAHGTSGVARCKFTKNLPPSSLGAPVRVMLFPSRV